MTGREAGGLSADQADRFLDAISERAMSAMNEEAAADGDPAAEALEAVAAELRRGGP